MEFLQSPIMIPLAALVTVITLVSVEPLKSLREKELDAQRELRVREMEHQQRMKELDLTFERERTHARA